MRFKEWMAQEGFRLDLADDEVLNNIQKLLADEDGKEHGFDGKQTAWPAQQRSRLVYHMTNSKFANLDVLGPDKKNSFIEVIDVFKKEDLPIHNIGPKKMLPSFEGAKIYYGFRFNAKEPPIEKILEPINQQIDETEKEIKKLEKKLDTSDSDEIDSDIISDEQKEVIRKVYNNFKSWDKYKNFRDNFHVSVNDELQTQNLKKLDQSWIRGYADVLNRKSVAPIEDIKEKVSVLCNNLNKVRTKKTYQKTIIIQSVQRSFMKKVKHPEQDKKLQDDFIELSKELYIKHKGNIYYDYIVYPESSSDFNQKLAMSLVGHYKQINPKVRAVQGLEKIPEPTMDQFNLDWRPNPKHDPNDPTSDKFVRRGLYPDLDDPEKRLAQMKASYSIAGIKWPKPQDDDVQDQGKKNKGIWQQKNVGQDQLRHYINNLKLTSGLGQVDAKGLGVGFKGRSLLFIDDNVASGSTLQRGYGELMKKGPRKIDIFVPIVYQAYHSGKLVDVFKSKKPAFSACKKLSQQTSAGEHEAAVKMRRKRFSSQASKESRLDRAWPSRETLQQKADRLFFQR